MPCNIYDKQVYFKLQSLVEMMQRRHLHVSNANILTIPRHFQYFNFELSCFLLVMRYFEPSQFNW